MGRPSSYLKHFVGIIVYIGMANLALEELSDAHLTALACAGKSSAFEEIIRRYQRKIFAYVYRLCNYHRDDALDVVQNVFLKAYENLRSFNRRRRFSSWLYRIAHNEAINWRKRETRRASVSLEDNEFLENVLAAPDDQHEQLLKKETFLLVSEVLEELPRKYREVLILRFLEEKSYDEMSSILKKPLNTIATLLNRSKKLFANLLSKKLAQATYASH